MNSNNEFTFAEINDEIDYNIKNEINSHFVVTGDVAKHIVEYLENEHEMPQFSEYDDESDKLYDFLPYEVYTISILADDDFMYFVQESYYEQTYGKILAEFGNDDEIVYIESATDLSLTDMKRVHGKQIIVFDLVDNDSDCCDCENCANDDDVVDLLLGKIKTLEDKIAELEKPKSTEKYYVDGKSVDKETYEKAVKEFDDEIRRFENRFFRFW